MQLMQRTLGSKLGGLPDLALSSAVWEAFWRTHPGAWASLISKFVARAAEEPAVFLAAITAGPQPNKAPVLEEAAEAGAADAAGPQPGVAAPPHEVAAAEAGEAAEAGLQPDLALAPADAALLVPAPGPDPLVCGDCGKRFAQ